jgi:hypothetical protein
VVFVAVGHAHDRYAELNPGKNDPIEKAEQREGQPATIDFAHQMAEIGDVHHDKRHREDNREGEAQKTFSYI